MPIKRNELGHRYYTQEDVERFKQIKGMKERGLQLKAIRMILRDGKLDMLPEEAVSKTCVVSDERFEGMGIEIVEERAYVPEAGEEKREVSADFKEDKARRLQWLLQEMIRQTIQETNQELCRDIRDSVVKELDYQFRMQEEREEAREQRLAARDEAYYKKMDELLRKKSRRGKKNDDSFLNGMVSADADGDARDVLAGRNRERSAEAVEEAIREKSTKHKKRHFF